MIGAIPTAVVARAAPSARVQRKRVTTDEPGNEEAGVVEDSEVAPHLRAGPAAPGFEATVASTPRPAMRNVASAALAAILKLQRGG